MFCDYANPKADSRNYGEVQELENLRGVVERSLVEYNSMSRKPADLVMFG
jgi:dynein heavy chain, axonemal